MNMEKNVYIIKMRDNEFDEYYLSDIVPTYYTSEKYKWCANIEDAKILSEHECNSIFKIMLKDGFTDDYDEAHSKNLITIIEGTMTIDFNEE